MNLPDWRPTLRRALDEDLPPVVLSIQDPELLRMGIATGYPLPAWEELPVDEHPHGPRHTGPPLDDAALAPSPVERGEQGAQDNGVAGDLNRHADAAHRVAAPRAVTDGEAAWSLT